MTWQRLHPKRPPRKSHPHLFLYTRARSQLIVPFFYLFHFTFRLPTTCGVRMGTIDCDRALFLYFIFLFVSPPLFCVRTGTIAVDRARFYFFSSYISSPQPLLCTDGHDRSRSCPFFLFSSTHLFFVYARARSQMIMPVFFILHPIFCLPTTCCVRMGTIDCDRARFFMFHLSFCLPTPFLCTHGHDRS